MGRGAHRVPVPRSHRAEALPVRPLHEERDHRGVAPRRRFRRRHLDARAHEDRRHRADPAIRPVAQDGEPSRARRGRRSLLLPRAGGEGPRRGHRPGGDRMSPSTVGHGRPHGDEPGERRAILHCDLDAFYASVEQRDHPEYRGKPVIVGGAKGERGVVSAASYEARVFGVRSAMPLQTATRLCPDGIFVPGDPEAYEKASDDVMALFAERTPLVEPISLDEAFLDVTATEHLFGGAVQIARDLKADVRAKCGLVLSVGVATNKLCAKVGSDLRKPDGLVVVEPGTEAAFLAPLDLQRLWGVGPKTRELLEGWGLRTIGDLARYDLAQLDARLGEHGRAIWERANGIDEGTVESYMAPKSVSNE